MAKNKNNAKQKATQFNAEIAEEAGTRNAKNIVAAANANEKANK